MMVKMVNFSVFYSLFIIYLQKLVEGTTWISYKTSCYYISTEEEPYSYSAAVECSKRYAILAEVTSIEEHQFLTAQLNRYKEYWVGLEKDPSSSNQFVWIFDRSRPLTYRDTDGNGPIFMHRYKYENNAWQLHDKNGAFNCRYICEKHKTYRIQITCNEDSDLPINLQSKQTTQSSVYDNSASLYGSSFAIDDVNGYPLLTCASTVYEADPWWQIDLVKQYVIYSVSLEMLFSLGSSSQSITTEAFVTDPAVKQYGSLISHTCGSIQVQGQRNVYITCNSFTVGRFIRITLSGVISLVLCNVNLNGTTCTQTISEQGCSNEDQHDEYTFIFNKDYPEALNTTCILPSFSSVEASSASPSSTQQDVKIPTTTLIIPGPTSLATEDMEASITPIAVSSAWDFEFSDAIKELEIDRKTFRSYRRTLVSVDDGRVSSKITGLVIGTVTVVLVLLFLVCFDLIRVVKCLSGQCKRTY